MTDFYTVLRSALDRVGAVEDPERERVYGHVRDVMVRKLRNYRPPLGEAEIESRISTFDAAIDRIEAEVEAERKGAEGAQTRPEPAAQTPARLKNGRIDEPPHVRRARANTRRQYERREQGERSPPPVPEAFAEEGYDEANTVRASVWDEPVANGNGTAEWGAAAPSPEPMWGAPAIDMAWDETSAQWHDARQFRSADAAAVAVEVPLDDAMPKRRGLGRFRRKAKQDLPDLGEDEDAPPRPDLAKELEGRRSGGLLQRLRRRPRRSNTAAGGHVEMPAEEPAPRRRPADASRRDRRKDRHDPIAALADRLDARGVALARAEPMLLAAPAASANGGLYLPSPDQVAALADDEPPRRAKRAARPERRRRAEERAEAEVPEAPPRRRHGRIAVALLVLFGIAVIGWSGYVLLQLLSSNDPAGETAAAAPETPAGAGEAIVLFQGADPTVFEAGADNPVRYQGDTAGGFVRIGSSITSGGARAIIGPGVANRLAGHEIRIVIEARGSPGEAAPAVRLAYQRGLTLLAWRIQALPSEFAVLSPTWTIPEGTTTGNDYLLIEPGVPGDATAVDIRSIRIEIVN